MAAKDPSTHISVQVRVPVWWRRATSPRPGPRAAPGESRLCLSPLPGPPDKAPRAGAPPLAAPLTFRPPPAAGESVTVSCEALSGLPELTLLYWLENGSFVESLHPDGAVREGTALEGSGLTLHRDLHFSSFNTQHLHTNFTCVVLSPLGVDTREVRWPFPALAPVTGKSAGLG
uniref:Uncharacterized protein n=1 Tax=Corvus moneduloides TaxID=1196302 RepID=A0A8C3DW97_CORMO